MTNWVAVSRQRHQHAGWQVSNTFEYAKQDHVIPVLANEVSKLLTCSVLSFVGNKDKGFTLVTLQSLNANENWFVADNGRWLGGYLPAFYRGYPFRLLPVNGTDDNNKVLSVDTEGGRWFEDKQLTHQPVFENGELGEELARLLKFLQLCEDDKLRTQKWVGELDEAGIIVPWNLKWQINKDAPVKQIEGLSRIDEDKLKQLEGDHLKALAESGALSLAYAQLFSLRHVELLRLLHSQKHNAAQVVEKEAVSSNVDLDQLFGDEDVLKF